jgi:hypothetical protein
LGLIYFEGWQQVLLFLVPIIALVFGLPPFEISIFNILVVLTFPFFSYFLLQEIGCGFTRFWANEVFSMARWPVHIVSSLGLFGRKTTWRSSAKNIKGQVSWKLMAPQITVLVLSLFAVTWAFFRLSNDFTVGPLFQAIFAILTFQPLPKLDLFAEMPKGYTLDLVAIAGAWALYSAVRAGIFIRKAIKDAQNSHTFFRFTLPLPAIIHGESERYGAIEKISEDWLRLKDFAQRTEGLKHGDTLTLTLYLPSEPLDLQVKIEKYANQTIEASILWSDVAARDQLAKSLYSVDWHREFLNRNAYFSTPSDGVMKLFKPAKNIQPKPNTWNSVLYNGGNDQLCGVIADLPNNKTQSVFITFKKLEQNRSYNGIELRDAAPNPTQFTIIKEVPISSLVRKGLDQSVVRKYLIEKQPAQKLESKPLKSTDLLLQAS